MSQLGWRIVVRPDGRVEDEEFPVPAPGPNQVLIRTEVTAVSAGTELGVQEQKRTGDYHPGYSNVGRIVRCGENVRGFEDGMRVLSFGNHASHVVSGATPSSLFAVPEAATSEEAAFGVIGSVSMHGARKARVEWGEHVLLVGAGMVGQLALQFLARCGGETLTVVDLSGYRLSIAREHGATHTLNPNDTDIRTSLEAITRGRGVDVTVEASGYPDVLPTLIEVMRIGGRIVLLGSIWHRPVTLDLMPFHEKELVMVGCHQPKCPPLGNSYYPWSQEYNRRTFLEWLAAGRLSVRPLITHKFPARDAARAYRLLRDERDAALGVVFDFVERGDISRS
jgi:2-desacetyl-2-hydroxyethyl bacteriochlorophyllide A dehydrogenase